MPAEVTAQQIIDRIEKNLGVPWKTPTVDGFDAGSSDTTVTGIVTTFAPTVPPEYSVPIERVEVIGEG